MSGLGSLHSPLAPLITDFVTLKRALGRQFAGELRVLADLDRFLAEQQDQARRLTASAFAAWCLTLEHLSPTTRRGRMRIVRAFCVYASRHDPGLFVPDPAGFPVPRPPRPPHIFSEQEIVSVLRATDALRPSSSSPLCGPVYRLAVVLLYTAGLRRGELVRLVISDYDPTERTLLVRSSKFHKSRLVALSDDAVAEMDRYLCARRRLPHDKDAPLLVSRYGGLRARSGNGLGAGLRRLFAQAGVVSASSGRPPRVHDLRHTHAVHALLRWYRAGVDVQAKLPALAMSMGHVSITSTAYYLSLLEPLAQVASELFAARCEALLAPDEQQGAQR